MNSQPNIVLADDHSMIRKGLKLHLKLNMNIVNIEEVSCCNELMKILQRKKFTHLILDIILSDGSSLEIIPNLKKLYPSLNIMIFSMQPAEVYGEALKQYGIEYYLSKTSGEDEIYLMLQQFVANEKLSNIKPHQNSNPFRALAPRELETLHYLLKGIGTKEIADTLNLKMNTISTIKNRIYEKTSAGNIKDLLELAALYNVNY